MDHLSSLRYRVNLAGKGEFLNQSKAEHLSIEFQQIEKFCDEEAPITLGLIHNHLERRGHALFTLFLAGPFLLPVPLPGLSMPFGIFIVFFAFAMAFEQKPFLPKSWLAREIPKSTLRKFCHYAQKFFQKFEKLFRPRLLFLLDSRAARFCIASMIATGGIMLAMPLPPGTNSPPATLIIVLSIGFLEQDGLLILLGYLLLVLNILFFGALGFYGYEGVMKVFDFALAYANTHF
jgi:hypothetical protein